MRIITLVFLKYCFLFFTYSSFAFEFLECSTDYSANDPYEGDYGEIYIKKISNDKYVGTYPVKLKGKYFFSSPFKTFLKPFDIKIEQHNFNGRQVTNFSNKEIDIDLSISKDSYSGVLKGSQVLKSVGLEQNFLCEEYDDADLFYVTQIGYYEENQYDLTNFKIFFNSKE